MSNHKWMTLTLRAKGEWRHGEGETLSFALSMTIGKSINYAWFEWLMLLTLTYEQIFKQISQQYKHYYSAKLI